MSRLDEIEARLEAASPGPWEVVTGGWQVRGPECNICGVFHHHVQIHDGGRNVTDNPAERDAELIANAPADLRYLLERVRELEAAAAEYVSSEIARRSCGEPFMSECYSEHVEYVEEAWGELIDATRGLPGCYAELPAALTEGEGHD